MEEGHLLTATRTDGFFKFIKYEASMFGTMVICEQGGERFTFHVEEIEWYANSHDTKRKAKKVHDLLISKINSMNYDQLCKIEGKINNFFKK